MQSGARIEDDVVRDFGAPEAELQAAASGSVLADLSHLVLLRIAGADAEAFLQGQLTCDVRALAPVSATPGAYCSPKGRMLADFLLLRGEGLFFMTLPRSLAEAVQKRLRMFVLRSRVEIDLDEGRVLLGAAGPARAEALRATDLRDALVAEVPRERTIAVVPLEHAPLVWQSLAQALRPAGTPCWEWLDIASGIPLILAATQDKLVPQMANLDLIGGVSFSKGCYTGQEIVARTHYLGKVKRRMYRARLPADARPQAGDELYSEDLGAQASGLVVNAQRAPGRCWELLAVMQISSRERSVVHLGSLQGPPLEFLPLPYEVA